MSKPHVEGAKWRPTTEKLPVRSKSCHACGETVLTGKEEGVLPHMATVDPHPLTNEGEYHALAAGRPTYGRSEGFELGKRTLWRIQHLPPEPSGYTVHATHQCGTPPFPHYPMPEKKNKKTKPENPPY